MTQYYPCCYYDYNICWRDVQAQEKDFDICSEGEPACQYYVQLGTAFPRRALAATVQLVNHRYTHTHIHTGDTTHTQATLHINYILCANSSRILADPTAKLGSRLRFRFRKLLLNRYYKYIIIGLHIFIRESEEDLEWYPVVQWTLHSLCAPLKCSI